MFDAIVQRIVKQGGIGSDHKRRGQERRVQDQCVAYIGNKNYPIENWSSGGVLIFAADNGFGIADKVVISHKFSIKGRIVDIQEKARVVRKGAHRVAFQFSNLSKESYSSGFPIFIIPM